MNRAHQVHVEHPLHGLVVEFRDADEIFLTSTAGGVMPVTRLDGRILGNGAPGAMTMRIRDLYWTWHREEAETTPVDYGC